MLLPIDFFRQLIFDKTFLINCEASYKFVYGIGILQNFFEGQLLDKSFSIGSKTTLIRLNQSKICIRESHFPQMTYLNVYYLVNRFQLTPKRF